MPESSGNGSRGESLQSSEHQDRWDEWRTRPAWGFRADRRGEGGVGGGVWEGVRPLLGPFPVPSVLEEAVPHP